MIQKNLLFALVFILSENAAVAQFIAKDQNFSANSVSNEGKVSGYAAQAGPYAIWLPDSGNVIIDIGGIAPGNGVGGQARFSTGGDFICGTSMGTSGPEMSKYNRTANQWTRLGSLGFSVDGTLSGGYGISGDGNTVVGNSWADTTGNRAYTHAIAYNSTSGLMDLGSMFDSIARSTRANASSYDASVVVGWQDFNGPWKSAVWRKNPAGGYFPNQYILIDTAGNPLDDYNQMGECSSVSANGKWIGGYGDYANNNQPWIWSKDSGVINLGTFANAGNGYVSGMTADASIVVGWFDGQLFGDPQTPFIWTRSGGLRELNEYIHTVLGDSTDVHQVYTADCISPDGHYIAGYGVNRNTSNYFVYRVSLISVTGLQEIAERNKIKVYPNPASNLVTIENANTAECTISSVDGKVVYRGEIYKTRVVDLSIYSPGIYLVSIRSGSSIETVKVVKE